MARKWRLSCRPNIRRLLLTTLACLIIYMCIYSVKRSQRRASSSLTSPKSYSVDKQLSRINPYFSPDLTQIKPLNINDSKSYEDIFGNSKIVQEVNFSFLINPSQLCSGVSVFVIAYIHSALENGYERQRIRRSWASVTAVNGHVLVSVFVLGKTTNEATQTKINEESIVFGDIVQVDFHDSYQNLTYKNLMGLEWIVTYCPQTQFVVKLDDDTLVDPYHLIKFLLEPTHQRHSQEDRIYCSVMSHIGVPQDRSDKWHIPARDYPYRYYPPYCEGFAYILTGSTARKLLAMAQYVPYFWIDDVYVTGFLTFRLDLELTNFVSGHGTVLLTPPSSLDHIANNIFFLAKNSFYSKNWNATWEKIKTFHLSKL